MQQNGGVDHLSGGWGHDDTQRFMGTACRAGRTRWGPASECIPSERQSDDRREPGGTVRAGADFDAAARGNRGAEPLWDADVPAELELRRVRWTGCPQPL